MPIRVPLSAVNSFTLRKQHLTQGSQGEDVLSVVRDVGPMRGAPPITPYLSLWARVKGFCREQLDRALYHDRSLIRVSAMHAHLYVLASDEYALYHQATGSLYRNSLQDLNALLAEAGADFTHSEALAQRVLEVIGTRGPHTADELGEILPELRARIYHDPDAPDLGHSALSSRIIPAMCAQGLLVRARPRGGWRSDTYSYAALSSWAPASGSASPAEGDAMSQVVRAYVSSFGPVSIGDVSHWLGGIHRREVSSALMGLRDRLVHVQIDGLAGDYVVLADQLGDLSELPGAGGHVCLLPAGDSYTRAYRDAGRLIPSPYRDRVIDRGGDALGTVWLDGFVIGIWGLQPRAARVWVRLFESVDPEILASVGELVYSLAAALGLGSLDIDMRTSAETAGEELRPEGVLSPQG